METIHQHAQAAAQEGRRHLDDPQAEIPDENVHGDLLAAFLAFLWSADHG
jgi:hypothetical protein